ncbi:NAD-dependent epimerase/dehydratase family protein [Roseiflexus sp.]|uniref:NAD-dependent epimerase/dehydratase family protein n=1 Tax=Roseiflexus sp. TaxID=2562120 RepID=UPI00398AAFDB
MHVLVTGGSGKAGRWVIPDLLNHGYRVTNVDLRPSNQTHTFFADLTDLGQTFGVLEGKDAVIHLAAIPWPGEHPPEVVYRINTLSTFNVLQAACVLGVRTVVLASSESALGFPFAFRPICPERLPIDETHPLLAQDAYGLSKIVLEELGRGFARRDPRMSIVALRFSYILLPDDYALELKRAWDNPFNNAFNFWAYVDARDVARACRLAIEHRPEGFHALYIAARDTLMREPTLDLLKQIDAMPATVAPHFGGRSSPLDCTRAARVIGWEPEYVWEAVVGSS